MATKRVVQGLIERGFDLSRAVPFERAAHIGCSECQALAINGVATHEHGCPNKPVECRECGTLIPNADKGQIYCDEHCANMAQGNACYCESCMEGAPACLQAMGCLCAGHVRNWDAVECDTSEAER